MGQRKLTDEELQDLMHARHYLRKVTNLGGHTVYASIVLDGLDNMAKECTTDGKPYVEPQPEIGEGYRPATIADKGRRDRDYWNPQEGKWEPASVGMYAGNYTYRVPIDRIPTDEDAKQRPIVMVRDRDGQPYKPAVLYGVKELKLNRFSVLADDMWSCHCQARFLYPGELD